MRKDIKAIVDRIEEIAAKTENMAAASLMLAILSDEDSDRPSIEVVKGTFHNIADQLEAMTDTLAAIATDLANTDRQQEESCIRDMEQAIRDGLELVKADEELDLDAEEMMALYDRFRENGGKGVFDAFAITVHDAFMAGLALGRQTKKEDVQEKNGHNDN